MNDLNRPSVQDDEAARLKHKHTVWGFVIVGVFLAFYIAGLICFHTILRPMINEFLNENDFFSSPSGKTASADGGGTEEPADCELVVPAGKRRSRTAPTPDGTISRAS